MSSVKQVAIGAYKTLPGHFKVEVRDKWCEATGVTKKTLDNRLSGALPFSPKELSVFVELVTEYKEFEKSQDETTSDPYLQTR